MPRHVPSNIKYSWARIYIITDTNGVVKLLHILNHRITSGPDEVHAHFLHSLSDKVAPALSLVFRQSIQSDKLPWQWKKAWITPVFKKGGHT